MLSEGEAETTCQPRDNRAAGNHSLGAAKEGAEAGQRNDLSFQCLKCSFCVSPSSSSCPRASLSHRHSDHSVPLGPQSWEGAVPAQLAVESSPPQLESPALLHTQCRASGRSRASSPVSFLIFPWCPQLCGVIAISSGNIRFHCLCCFSPAFLQLPGINAQLPSSHPLFRVNTRVIPYWSFWFHLKRVCHKTPSRMT